MKASRILFGLLLVAAASFLDIIRAFGEVRHVSRLRSAWEQLVGEYDRLASAIDRDPELLKAGDRDAAILEYPAIRFTNLDFSLPAENAHAVIMTARSTVEANSPLRCFSASGAFAGSKPCLEMLKQHCSGLHVQLPGVVYRVKINDDLSFARVPVQTPEEFVGDLADDEEPDAEEILWFSFCSAVAESGFQFNLLEHEPRAPRWLLDAPMLGPLSTVSTREVDRICGPIWTHGLRIIADVWQLIDLLPAESRARSKWMEVRKLLRAAARDCDKLVAQRCANVFFAKEVAILSYVNLDCKRREVTAGDVANDLKLMQTEAERLQHSALIDEIAFCQTAHERGAYWLFRQPEISGCRKRRSRRR